MDFILDVYVGWCLFFCFSLEIGCTGMKSEILSIKIKCIKNREKEKWKMKDKIFGVLQRIGRSFMLPIAILPVAGLLLGIGSSFTNETTIATYGLQKILGDGTVLHALLTIMNKVGSAVFDNLPLIFAVGVAIGMAKKEKEVSALSALIAYFVMNVAINGMLVVNGEITADGEIAKNVLEGTVASVCGIQSLQMGVFGGIIVGLGVAALHNRFHKIVLPNALSFFGGSRFVPIISTIVYMFVGIGMYFIWPPVQNGIYALGGLVTGSGYVGTLIFGIIKRALIPFGLHHVFYMPFWQTAVGGSMEVAGQMVQGGQNIFFAFFVFSAQMLCLEILQIDGRSHLVADSDFLARSIYQFELAFREEDSERNARETSAAAEIENLRARTEMDGLGYCQRMEHVVLVQIIDVLAADDIDFAVPVAV